MTPTADGQFSYGPPVSTPDLSGGLYVIADGGTAYTPSGSVRVFHYTSPGVLDTFYPDVTFTGAVKAAAVDTTGRLYVLYAGQETTNLARYTGAGVLDSTFGTGGVVSSPQLSFYARSLAVGSGDVYVGTGDDAQAGHGGVVQAFTTAGAVDTAFGTAGTVTLEQAGTPVVAQLAVVTGALYVVDDGFGGDGLEGRLLRLNPASGVLDNTFGRVLEADQSFGGIGVDGSGRLYAEVNTEIFNGSDATAVLRLTSTGADDSSYGTAGVLTLPASAAVPTASGLSEFDGSTGTGVLTAPDGSVYAERQDCYQGQPGFACVGTLTRATAAGAVDRTFGTNGVSVLTGTAANPFSYANIIFAGTPVLLSTGLVAVAGAVVSGQIGVGELTNTTAPGRFVPAAARLADSISSTSGFVRPNLSAVSGQFSGTAITHVTSAVPSDASAVSLEVSVVDPVTSGYLRVTSGDAVAAVTALNFTQGISQTMLVSTPVASDGRISVTVVGTANVVVDQLGYDDQYGPVGGQALTTITPTRALDTRDGVGAPAGPKSGLFTVRLPSSVPAGATAVLDVTATTPAATGYLQLDAHGGTPVTALNYAARVSATALTYTTTDSNREIDITTHGSTQVVVDVVGYLTPASGNSTAPGLFVPVPATRIVDSRVGVGLSAGPKTGQITVTIPTSLVPDGATAPLLNITAITPSGAGYATVKALGDSATAAFLNVAGGQSRTALTVTAPNASNQIVVAFDGFRADITVDLLGYYN